MELNSDLGRFGQGKSELLSNATGLYRFFFSFSLVHSTDRDKSRTANPRSLLVVASYDVTQSSQAPLESKNFATWEEFSFIILYILLKDVWILEFSCAGTLHEGTSPICYHDLT